MIFEVSFGKRRVSLCCRYRSAQPTTPSAALGRLRGFFILPQPPLLFQEGGCLTERLPFCSDIRPVGTPCRLPVPMKTRILPVCQSCPVNVRCAIFKNQ